MQDVGVEFAQRSGEAVAAQVLTTELTEEQTETVTLCFPDRMQRRQQRVLTCCTASWAG